MLNFELWLRAVFFVFILNAEPGWTTPKKVEIRHGNQSDFHQLNLFVGHLLRYPTVVQCLFEVEDVTDLRRNGDSFFVFRPNQPVVTHRIVGVGELLCVEHVAANHHSSSSLPSFAVDSRDIFLVRFQPGILNFIGPLQGQRRNRRSVRK